MILRPYLFAETACASYLFGCHNTALAHGDAESFARGLLTNLPPPPADREAIVAANRRGRLPAPA